MSRIHVLALLVLLGPLRAQADFPLAPGAPGAASTFPSGAKEGFGTARARESRVWFTLTNGAVSEVFHPRISNPMLRGVEFAVSDGRTFTHFETADMEHRIAPADSCALLHDVTTFHRGERYVIRKRVFTDPFGDALVVRVSFRRSRPDQVLYLLVDPLACGTGDNDEAALIGRNAFLVRDTTCAVLESDIDFVTASAGFRGVNDGYTQLARSRALTETYAAARDGNVSLAARLNIEGEESSFSLVVGFGANVEAAHAAASATRARGLDRVERAYVDGWRAYGSSLRPPPADDALYYASAMILAACEDKENPGAFVASPSMAWGDIGSPWGDIRGDTNDQYYWKVWSRDLYHTAIALLHAGDTAAALRALAFLDDRAQLSDGSFPQNTDVTGRPVWPTVQMDQVACPILLAHALVARGLLDPADRWTSLVRPAADYILEHGPYTLHERWEDREGYSPASIASQIAGLRCAAAIAEQAGDPAAAARYRRTAGAWDAANEDLTVTVRENKFNSSGHYIRISRNGRPNESNFSADELDVSFLELVRLGVRAPDEPLILSTLAACDSSLKVDLPGGAGWRRFGDDRYGEDLRGRAWPLLTGERGHYEIASGRSAENEIRALRSFASPGLTLSEQVWDDGPRAGRATGSSAPLAWAHSEYLLLVLSESAGIVMDRPALPPEPERPRFFLLEPRDGLVRPGDTTPVILGISGDTACDFSVRADEREVSFERNPGRIVLPPWQAGESRVVDVVDAAGRILYRRILLDARARESEDRRRIRSISVTGSFCSWNPNDPRMVMTRDDSGIHSIRLRLPAGRYEYKYAANGGWEINFGGEGSEIRQDGPNYRLDLDRDAEVIFSILPGAAPGEGWQSVDVP